MTLGVLLGSLLLGAFAAAVVSALLLNWRQATSLLVECVGRAGLYRYARRPPVEARRTAAKVPVVARTVFRKEWAHEVRYRERGARAWLAAGILAGLASATVGASEGALTVLMWLLLPLLGWLPLTTAIVSNASLARRHARSLYGQWRVRAEGRQRVDAYARLTPRSSPQLVVAFRRVRCWGALTCAMCVAAVWWSGTTLLGAARQPASMVALGYVTVVLAFLVGWAGGFFWFPRRLPDEIGDPQ